MKSIKASLLALLLLGLFAIQAQAQSEAKDNLVSIHDLVYFADKGTTLRLDIVRPAQVDGSLPAVIFLPIPTTMARSTYAAQIVSAAKKGYVGVTLGYHYIEIENNGKARYPFPTQLLDVKRAIRWLKANAEKYHIDAGEIGVIGWSYGGYLALMAGFTGPDDGLEPAGDGPDTKVQAVVSMGGFIDWTKLDESDAAWSLGGTADQIPDVYTKASPLTYVKSDNPAVLLLYGKRDGIVPYEDANVLDQKLADAGVQHSLFVINEADHLDVAGYADKGIVWGFFDQNLKKQAAAPSGN